MVCPTIRLLSPKEQLHIEDAEIQLVATGSGTFILPIGGAIIVTQKGTQTSLGHTQLRQ